MVIRSITVFKNYHQVLVIPWFMHMYNVIMHEHEQVHYHTYIHRTMV